MISLSEDLSRILRNLWHFLTELPSAISYDRRNIHNRSIIRTFGTILPLAPAPRVIFNLAAWNPELERFTDNSGCEIISPKVQPPDSSNYQGQIDELQEELKAVKVKLALLLEKETSVKLERLAASQHGSNVVSKITIPPPPPPPPPPMPDLTLVTSKPPHIRKTKRSSQRSPGGRPIKQKREPVVDTNDILAQVLKKRYSAIQESSDAESFNASFTDISSPIKSAAC